MFLHILRVGRKHREQHHEWILVESDLKMKYLRLLAERVIMLSMRRCPTIDFVYVAKKRRTYARLYLLWDTYDAGAFD